MSDSAREEIAIVGMAGRFPGARDIAEFWRNLRDGVESVTSFTPEELSSAGVDAAVLQQPGYVNAGTVLAEADAFDAAFFGMLPREAELTDPQHRIFLECAWTALEHAGYDPERYEGLIGVYGGVARNTYLLNNLSTRRDLLDAAGAHQSLIATDKDFSPTRVSYKLNLKGPSINVQTACSTSGVAIHLACQALFAGDCDMALAGGARVRVPLKGRLPLRRRRHSVARWALPRLRRKRPRHDPRQRRGAPCAEAALRCATRWRHHSRDHQRHRHQQRRFSQDRLHRAEHRWPGASDCGGARSSGD
jgi:acyl transferase domain-containing protein